MTKLHFPDTFVGNRLRLVKFQAEHVEPLAAILTSTPSFTRDKWRVFNRDDFSRWVDSRLVPNDTRSTFVHTIEETGEPAGVTQFKKISASSGSLEIGQTWIATPWQRTFVNTEAKLLMLDHAFRVLRFSRVEFTVDTLNPRSARALERIGARYERELPNDHVAPDGSSRTLRVYRILDHDWAEVRAALERRISIAKSDR